ncbi:MAG: chromosomal replication initiator protein DnaA, partial [Burkholderiales bacterium]|nr:chromosomal replication initiator protein DnaA [Burkholderiales bacterium]
MERFWLSCLSRLENELPAQQFNTWIKPLRLDSKTPSGQIALLAPNRFVLDWIKNRYLARIEAMAAEYFSSPIRVSLAMTQSEPAARPPAASITEPARRRSSSLEKAGLIPEFTFDNFVIGKANQLARAAGLPVSEHPGTSYNPLFVYGGVGLGKTHLIHAVGNNVLAQHPTAKVRYLHAAQYISDVVRAYHQKSFDEYKRYYHSLDLLLIDDIQFFSGKDRTQEEFFYAFNALIEAHKQVIITCDTYPKDINGIEERLKSRFSWGLSVGIEPPVPVVVDFKRGRAAHSVDHTEVGLTSEGASRVFLDVVFKIISRFAETQGIRHDGPFEILGLVRLFWEVIRHRVHYGESGRIEPDVDSSPRRIVRIDDPEVGIRR